MADNITETGGPAFPIQSVPGMTLRDWFAGQALASIAENYNGTAMDPERTARSAYDFADAMLRAR